MDDPISLYYFLAFMHRIGYNHCRSLATVAGRDAIQEMSDKNKPISSRLVVNPNAV